MWRGRVPDAPAAARACRVAWRAGPEGAARWRRGRREQRQTPEGRSGSHRRRVRANLGTTEPRGARPDCARASHGRAGQAPRRLNRDKAQQFDPPEFRYDTQMTQVAVLKGPKEVLHKGCRSGEHLDGPRDDLNL